MNTFLWLAVANVVVLAVIGALLWVSFRALFRDSSGNGGERTAAVASVLWVLWIPLFFALIAYAPYAGV